jgi:hypothetical protein
MTEVNEVAPAGGIPLRWYCAGVEYVFDAYHDFLLSSSASRDELRSRWPST